MFILRVTAQLLIAAAVMVLGFDALNALESGTVDPIAGGELVALIVGQLGLADGLDMERILGVAEGWPGALAAPYAFLVAAPAFLILGVLGGTMALLFRARN